MYSMMLCSYPSMCTSYHTSHVMCNGITQYYSTYICYVMYMHTTMCMYMCMYMVHVLLHTTTYICSILCIIQHNTLCVCVSIHVMCIGIQIHTMCACMYTSIVCTEHSTQVVLHTVQYTLHCIRIHHTVLCSVHRCVYTYIQLYGIATCYVCIYVCISSSQLLCILYSIMVQCDVLSS